MTRDTTASERRLTRTQTAIVSLVAVVCILLAGATLVTAQSGTSATFTEDGYGDNFEDGDVAEYAVTSGDGSVQVVNESVLGGTDNYELRLGSSGEQYATAETNTTISLQGEEVDGHADFRIDHSSWGDSDIVRLTNDAGDVITLYAWFTSEGGLVIADQDERDAQNDTVVVPADELPGHNTGPSPSDLNLNFSIDFVNDEIDATVTNPSNGNSWTDTHQMDSVNSRDNWTVSYRLREENEDFGTSSTTWIDNVEVGGVSLNGTPGTPDSPELRLDVPGYLQHNASSRYSVEYNDGGAWEDVTADATVTPDNTDALTFYDNGTVVAGGNKSINEKVGVTAEYQGLAATDYTVVATPTVDNLDLLPAWWSVNAVLSDWTMIWILLSTLIATAASRMSTTFAGIGAFVMAMIMGWIMGDVPDGIMVATIFMGLFIGLNLAANIDYSVR